MFAEDEMGEVIDGDTLRFVRVVKHSPDRVWRAISDEAELRAWMRYPVNFAPREGGVASFFGEGRIEGRVFIFDPPRVLAFSFFDAKDPDRAAKIAREWTVRWDLEPVGGSCRITFTHRHLGGAHLWGLGEGWHGFLVQLVAYLDGTLAEVLAEQAQNGGDANTEGLTLYRAHVSRALLRWAEDAARRTRDGDSAAQSAIDDLSTAVRQLYEIARQDGPYPDYAPDERARRAASANEPPPGTP